MCRERTTAVRDPVTLARMDAMIAVRIALNELRDNLTPRKDQRDGRVG